MIESDTIIKLAKSDNVGIARAQILAGHSIGNLGLVARQDIPPAHKIALQALRPGEPARRYGEIIGFATVPIAAGDHVHSHNLAMGDFVRDYAVGAQAIPPSRAPGPRTFLGIKRSDGRVATRNYIGILSTVNCSATVTKKVARYFDQPGALDDYPNVDGVVPLAHSFGCCIDHQAEGIQQLRRTLAGYIRHANFAAVVIVGLGCEANQLGALFMAEGLASGPTIRPLVMQDLGGTQKTVDAAIEAVRQMLPAANAIVREPLALAHLKIALQCGGSDGYSGITANPALGVAVDKLVAHGGGAILSETPEIYGAEHLLTRRAATAEVAAKLIERIRWWESYAKREGGSIDNNPTPGNKAGGLTTILEKSLGAVAKSGSSPLRDVYRYAEPVTSSGLVFMDAPGYDPVGATGQIASGANLVAFTTGRGSCFGAKPAPSIKIATNSAMYRRMQDDMDVNCGAIMDGQASLEEMGDQIFETIIRVASGERSKSERLGLGDEEFVPWMIGGQF